MGHDDTATGQCEEARLYAKEVYGRSKGLREAGNLVMERAVEEFKRGSRNRELAETLRAIASLLLDRADTVRQNTTLRE